MSGGGRQITGRTVLAGLLIFFGVVMVANVAFVWLASATWSGLSTENAYRKGLDYNETLARAEAQAALGWQARTEVVETDGGRRLLSLHLTDNEGQAIDALQVTATFRRPVAEGSDFSQPMERTRPGSYEARFSPPAPGQWDVRIEVARPDGPPYLVETRIRLK